MKALFCQFFKPQQASFSLFFACLLIFTNGFTQESIRFQHLKVDGMETPTEVESTQPLFSWVVQTSGFNKSQTAYHILVASSIENLATEKADVWNSEKVQSNASIHVKYAGIKLHPMATYYWKVKIWDEKGKASGWSHIQSFRMGLYNETSWGNAKWITLTKDTRSSGHRFRDYITAKMDAPTPVEGYAAAYFRKEYLQENEIASATAYVVGLGYYELFINGEKISDHVLDPAPSNYDKQAYYVAHDVTKNLKVGKNALGLTLGNGFYGQNISWKNDAESEKDLAYGPPTVRLMLVVKQKNGLEKRLFTDGSWKENTGPIVFNNIYGGDTYDANFELGDWKSVGYQDKAWGVAKETQPEITRISAQNIPAIKRLKVIEAVRVFQAPDKAWIVDFGQNIAGWIQLEVQESEGKLIEIEATEALYTNGLDVFPGSTGGGANGMPQVYKYICKSSEKENWEPSFSYHGFRYAKIKGLSTKPGPNTLKAVLVATDLKTTGSFYCSDSLLNKMHDISKWTIETNIHGIPEDCPHREKCGWLGDAHAFCEYALYNYDMYTFYKKYMKDIKTQMRPLAGKNNPEQSFMVPTMIAPGKRTSTYAKLDWGIATMYLPWYNYLYYGDSTIVKDYYPEMKNLTEFYLSFKDKDGIIQDGMGDWCPPRWDRRLNPSAMECDPIISANAYFYDVLGIMEIFARMNGDISFEKQMKEEKESLKKAFSAVYLKSISEAGAKWYQSQTATVQALQFGLVPEEEIESVLQGLLFDIQVNKGEHHSTGIHGNRYIYTILSKLGKADLAYDLLTTPTFPSQTYIMNSGFTTWPERQFEWEKMEGPTNSLNHPMHSGFAAFFYETLGGIKSQKNKPGYKEFVVLPQFPSKLSSTKITVPTPYGSIYNSWQLTKGLFTMELEVPFNTKARLILIETELKSLKINGKPLEKLLKKDFIKVDGNSMVILGSGNYQIEYLKDLSTGKNTNY